jgi:Flp pilus assembly protein TadG
MMIRQAARRRGVTTVEAALVLIVFCMLLFGVFEYCRFLYTLHVTNNAARDGARYAVVNMDKPTNFNVTDYTDGQGKTFPSITRYTNERMGVTRKQLTNYKVGAFAVDSASMALTPPVVRPKSKTGVAPYPDPFNPSDPNHVPWNQATFTEGVGVAIEGQFKPLLPRFLLMPSSVKVAVTAVANSEG